MTIHRPGRPEDLPTPEVLWARWGLLAVLEATTEAEEMPPVHRTGCWIDGAGLHLDDSGCTRWTLARMGEGRFVLYGEDESSEVKWHEPAVDMLAGAPDWLPHDKLRDLLQGYELGCVYWYENGAWARAPYPQDLDDDGLDCGMSRFVDRSDVLSMIEADDDFAIAPAPGTDAGPADRGAEALLSCAERYALTPRVLESLVAVTGDDEQDVPAMLRTLGRTGLAGESAAAEVAEGRRTAASTAV